MIPKYTITPCKTKKGISVKPMKTLKLNLGTIKKNQDVILDAEVLLVINLKGEIIIHGHGELLFKELKDVEQIKKIADQLYTEGLE